MFTYALIWLAIVAVALFFGWLALRALRLRNPGARFGLATLAALPALLFALVAGLIAYGYGRFYLPGPSSPLALDTTASPERLARGAHLARTVCAACHTTNGELPLSGGVDLSSHSPLPIGVLVPPNLTPAGAIATWSDLEIAQAIRNGRHRSGRALLMPTESLRSLSDEDLASLVVYLRSQPPVQNATPPVAISPVLAMVFGAGLAEPVTPPVAGPVVAPPREPSVAYGAYIADYQDCRTCHGAALTGSSGGLGPAAPNARAFAKAWTLEQFISTMRTGVDPDGRPVQETMPWKTIGQMDDDELAALYIYLRSDP